MSDTNNSTDVIDNLESNAVTTSTTTELICTDNVANNDTTQYISSNVDNNINVNESDINTATSVQQDTNTKALIQSIKTSQISRSTTFISKSKRSTYNHCDNNNNDNDGTTQQRFTYANDCADGLQQQQEETTTTVDNNTLNEPYASERRSSIQQVLSNDVDANTAIQLLCTTLQQYNTLNDLLPAQIELLSEFISFIKLNKNEKIIEKNEIATFLGFVLSGTLAVQDDSSNSTIIITTGSLLGELSLFSDDKIRTADVISECNDSIIGVITYNDLMSLGEVDGSLLFKLLVTFANISIKKINHNVNKLDKQNHNNNNNNHNNNNNDDNKNNNNNINTTINNNETNKENISDSNNNKLNASIVSNEHLFRVKQKDVKNVTATNDDKANNAAKSKKNALNNNIIIESQRYKIDKLEQQIQIITEQNIHQLQQINKLNNTIAKLSKKLNDMSDNKINVESNNIMLQTQYNELNNRYNNLLNDTKNQLRDSDVQHQTTINNLNAQIIELNSKLDSCNNTTINTEQHNNIINEYNNKIYELQQNNISLQQQHDMIYKEYRNVELQYNALKNEHNDVSSKYNALSNTYNTTIDQNSDLLPYKQRYIDVNNKYNQLHRNYENTLDRLNNKINDLRLTIKQCKSLVFHISCNMLAKQYKQKRYLKIIHTIVHKILIALLEQQAKIPVSNVQQSSIEHSNTQTLLQQYNQRNLKHLYGNIKSNDLIGLLEHDINTLIRPVTQLQYSIDVMTCTCNSFFSRVNELNNEIMKRDTTIDELNKQLDVLNDNQLNHNNAIKQQQIKYDTLLQQYNTCKTELAKYNNINYVSRIANKSIQQQQQYNAMQNKLFALQSHIQQLTTVYNTLQQQQQQQQQQQSVSRLQSPTLSQSQSSANTLPNIHNNNNSLIGKHHGPTRPNKLQHQQDIDIERLELLAGIK